VIKPPSLTGDYDLVYSGDPALDAPPEPVRNEDETQEAYVERATKFYESAEWKEWREKLRLARETGSPEAWQSLLKPGGKPTLFRMGRVDGNVWRSVLDHINVVGLSSAAALVFRAAIKGFVEFDFKIDYATDKTIDARIASPKVVSALDAIHPGIVSELGNEVYRRMTNPSPLS
jgi:hypothetical protein